jgi:hypothetical protein
MSAFALGGLVETIVARAGAARETWQEIEAVMRDNPEFRAWVDRARAVEIGTFARARGLTLRGTGEMVGPCPDCGGSDRFAINTRKQVFNCRGCGAGGDVIALAELVFHCDFREACRVLTGEDAPDGRAGTVDHEAVRRVAEQRARDEAQRAAEENAWRERERAKAYEFWRSGRRLAGTEAADYLAGRGLGPVLDRVRLRHVDGLDYWHQRTEPGRKKPVPFVLHHGPAMLAPITDDDDRFAGVHMTWFLPMRPGEKVDLADPQSGEALPAKKIRGSKRRGWIRLITPARFDRLVAGEGIETVLSVAVAELGTPAFERTAYWSSIDLQHLGGRAADRMAHPELKTRSGRAQTVPGGTPDDDPAAPMPPHCVREILTLGDGDSDRFTADLVHARAARRWARDGRTIRTAFAPQGADFNTVLRGVA